MKKLVLSVFVWVIVAFTMAQGIHRPFNLNEIEAEAQAKSKFVRLMNDKGSSGSTTPLDLTWVKAIWNIDPAIRYIKGDVLLKGRVLEPTDTISLSLSDSLTVDSVYLGGVRVAYHRTRDGLLDIDSQGIAAQQHFEIRVFYQGVPPSTGFGSFGVEPHEGVPALWTLSQPYGASDWWPCQNTLTDKIDSLDVYVVGSAQYIGVSNGMLADTTRIGGDRQWHWKHRYPIATYLIAIAMTNYSVYEETAETTSGPVLIQNFMYPENLASSMVETAGILGAYPMLDSLFGPYPFIREKYGHAQFGWGGGMEHQTITFIGGINFHIMSHELGHMWFGDMVTCGRWYDLWLNEGWASYVTGLCYENLINGIYWEPWKEIVSNGITKEPGGRVFPSDTLNVPVLFDSRLTYAKASYVIHMLRGVMGDSLFYGAARSYLSDPGLQYSFARTEAFIKHMEEAYGGSLAWFFEPWLEGEGYPNYQGYYFQQGDSLTLDLYQTTSHPSVPFYRMPVPIRVWKGGVATDFKFWHEQSGQRVRFYMPDGVDSLSIDPDRWILWRENSVGASGIEEDNLVKMVVYPNPVKEGKIVILVPNQRAEVDIVNQSGVMIKRLRVTDKTQIEIDVNALSPGIYLVRYLGAGGYGRTRFLKI